MFDPIYKKTMKTLAKALSQKLSREVTFNPSSFHRASSQKKWVTHNGKTFIPLSFHPQFTGHFEIKPSPVKETAALNEVYYLIEWTLISLKDIFEQSRGLSFQEDKTNFPLLIESSCLKTTLSKVYDLYDESGASFFIHFKGSRLDPAVFSSDLRQAFIFISNLAQLSKEDQLLLSHFLRTNKNGEYFLAAGLDGSAAAGAPVISSLMECFESREKH